MNDISKPWILQSANSPQEPAKRVWFRNVAQVLTFDVTASHIEDWSQMSVLGARKSVDLVVEDGKVVFLGPDFNPDKSDSQSQVQIKSNKETVEIDARHLVLMPGLVDAHTHPVFVGSRAKETVQKASGLTYEEIAVRGGGIGVTSASCRAASDQQLSLQLKRHWKAALDRGVVLMESKTGYGLSPLEEGRHLKVMAEAALSDPLLPFVAPTLLGPHASSPEHSGLDSFLQALIDDLPKFRSLVTTSKKLLPLAADIFIERGYFSKDHGEKWLGAALQLGLDVHVHGDEFSRSGGSELAVALAMQKEQNAEGRRPNGRVLSVDHCQYATEMDLSKFRRYGISAVALPATSFFSKIPYVDANKWRASGVRAAIASDFNPGTAPLNSLWFSAYLALSHCGFSLSEVLAGVTLNAAYALGAEDRFGFLKVEGPANLIAFDGDSAEDFFASPLGDHLRVVVLS